MRHKLIKTIATCAAAASMTLGGQGCSLMSCDNYRSYDDILNTWVGADLEEYERSNQNRPYETMERPRNVMEYAFNTPYTNYDGSQHACRTWLDVDRATGKILSWRHEGECYMHGRCVG